jgi:FXSXX-COOH protein
VLASRGQVVVVGNDVVKRLKYMDLADGLESDLVDLGEIGLDKLGRLDGSALERALRRVRADAARPQDALAGFNSAL